MKDKFLNGTSYETIVRWFRTEHKSTSVIASTLGCSRQRVSQILRTQGVDVHSVGREIRTLNILRKRPKQESATLEHKAEVAARRQNRAARSTKRLQELWSQGKSFQEIAKQTRRTVGSVKETIYRLRKKYGWFPKRTLVA